MRCHWLRLRATAHATEDLDKVIDAIHALTGLPEEAFAAATEVTDIESHHGTTVHLVETTIKNQRPIREALERLLVEPEALLPQIDARTDEDGIFYLRFDKQQALSGQVVPTRGEDAVQVRLKPEVHPASRDRAMDAIRERLTAGA